MASLFVYMNGYEVGEYIQRRGGEQEFIYSDSWLEYEELAVPLSLSLPLTDKKHRGDSVYNYFDNLLPDSLDIRNRIQARFGAKTNRPFDLLSSTGRDCVGAIQLLPARTDVNIKKIKGTPLSEKDIAGILRNYETLPLGMSRDQDFRISIAGAQEKTALLWRKKRWHRPDGVTPTTHIFKMPIGENKAQNIDLKDSVENEWLCLEILGKYGLPVPGARIETFEDMKVLVVERFDREFRDKNTWILRLPVEDMCQAHGVAPALKYESDGGPGIRDIMKTLKSSIHAEHDRKQFMKTVFLFWMLGAIDGHAKNFSIFLKQGGRFHLAPLYDVLSAYPLANKKQIDYQEMKMAMVLRGKNRHYQWQYMLPRHWYSESDKNGFPKKEMEEIIELVTGELENVISDVTSGLPGDFPAEIADSIFNGMRKAGKKINPGKNIKTRKSV